MQGTVDLLTTLAARKAYNNCGSRHHKPKRELRMHCRSQLAVLLPAPKCSLHMQTGHEHIPAEQPPHTDTVNTPDTRA